ncbi:hypothetical protein NO1_1761 [Candidatus Termititenax aidoneus]|uniref:Bacterial repeat domain-containing protein n=1 Tax=Termititenax aidoneus TaxID=2218524 RepID=A0A388TDP5_TERA1|nr:hypothetical protein NO1_1761 [Candidatus Termititenax aidoneus]
MTPGKKSIIPAVFAAMLVFLTGCGLLQKDTFLGSTTPDDPMAKLSVSVSGNGYVEVISSGNQKVSGNSLALSFLKGTALTLNAVPSPNPDAKTFSEWIGGVTPTNNSEVTLNINADLNVQAVFSVIP